MREGGKKIKKKKFNLFLEKLMRATKKQQQMFSYLQDAFDPGNACFQHGTDRERSTTKVLNMTTPF